MNYYSRHLGDYAKDTKHLSLAEHGAYCLLLDYFYATEKPIPDDRCERIATAYADHERIAVRSVLAEFFTETPEGWVNKRAVKEIEAYRDKSLKAKASAEARWAKHDANAYANASNTNSERNASHKPITNNQEPTTKAKATERQVARTANRFDEFWTAYPVKKGKADAEKKWKSKGLDSIADQILAHVELMKRDDRDWLDGYAPHGSTYVNSDGWNDSPKAAAPTRAAPQQPSKTLAAIQNLEGMKNGLDDTRDHDRLPKAALSVLGPYSGH